jgi:ribonuclease-3
MTEETGQSEAVAELFGLQASSELFLQAVTHPSFAHETPEAAHNQRLEFLGDAILDFVVSEELYKRFSDSDEGKLTRTRAQIVSTGALAKFAHHHQIGGALRFGRGAAQSNLTESDNVLADAVEALIAAAYLEEGIAAATKVCLMVLEFGLGALSQAGARDAKSELQEKVQALGLRAPSYRVTGTEGPAHEAVFEVEVSVEGTILNRGSGRSKRAAEREAAQQALSDQKYVELRSPPEDSEEAPC